MNPLDPTAAEVMPRPETSGPSPEADLVMSLMKPQAGAGQPIQGPPASDPQSIVEELLSHLEMAKAPSYQPQTFRQRFFGTLADALMAASRARVGAAPGPGAYGERIAAEQEAQRTAESNVMKYNTDLKNQARLSLTKEILQGQTAKDVAGIRGQASLKGMRLTKDTTSENVNGIPTTVTRFYNPSTGEVVATHIGGERGFAPTIIPGQWVDTDTGEVTAGFARIPRTAGGPQPVGGGAGGPGKTFQPTPPAGFMADVATGEGVLTRFPKVQEAYQQAVDEGGGTAEGVLAKAWRQAEAAAATSSTGQFIAPPALIRYYAKMKSVLFPIVKRGSGVAFSAKELDKWQQRFPVPGVHDPETADFMWDSLIDEMVADIQAKYHVAGRKRPGGAPAAPTAQGGKTTDQVLEDIRKRRLGGKVVTP